MNALKDQKSIMSNLFSDVNSGSCSVTNKFYVDNATGLNSY